MIEINQSYRPILCISDKTYYPLMETLHKGMKAGDTHVSYALSGNGYIMLFYTLDPEKDDALGYAYCTPNQMSRFLLSGVPEELTNDKFA